MPLQTGKILSNRYRIVKLLGQGGFGAVYRAWDMNMECPRALKENLDTSPEAQKQFKREAQILGQLTHPNLPHVVDHFIIPGQGQYLVMDYVEGEDLDEMVKRVGGPLPESQVIPWIGQVCDALTYLHSQNPPIIHRDVKPANIKITPQGVAKLVDFGIAKIFDPNLRTTIGARAVTPGYSPHEQYGQGKTDPRTDIYALGATLYTLLTGQVPAESIQRMISDPLVPPERVNPTISPGLAEAILQAMQPDPNQRQQSTEALKTALHTSATAPIPSFSRPVAKPAPLPVIEPVKAPPAIQPKSTRKWVPWIGIGIVLVILVVFTGIGYGFGWFDNLLGLTTATPLSSSTRRQPTTTPLPSVKPATALPAAPPREADCASGQVFCVGLVTDGGKVTDKAFNQAAWEGLQAAEAEFHILIHSIETRDSQDYAANIAQYADKNFDAIVTVGFLMADVTARAAQEYPEIDFIGVDQFYEGVVPNYTALSFHEDEAGFLAGALAASISQTGTVAGVFGPNLVPPVVAFKEGYEAGARYINSDIQVISTYHPGGLDVAFTDPDWGAETAKQAIAKGADVVFGAGGTTGDGALIATASNPGAYCIGVDVDQWWTLPKTRPCLVSSAIKKFNNGVFLLTRKSMEGNFPGGVYYGEVGLTPFYDFDSQVPPEVKEKLSKLEDGLNDGSVSTGVAP
jgi:basic membrane protein A